MLQLSRALPNRIGVVLRQQQSAFFLALFLSVEATSQPLVEYLGGDQIEVIMSRRKKISDGLNSVGLVEGRDFVLHAQTYSGDKLQLTNLAKKLAESKPRLIYAGSWDAANELKKYTSTIPIIFSARANLESPVFRIVDNLQVPERNLTGFTHYVNLIPKKLQLLKDAFPAVRQVGFVYGVDIRPEREREYSEAARKIGIELKYRRIQEGDIFDLAEKLNGWDDAYLVAFDQFLVLNRAKYVEQLAKTKKPVIHPEEATNKGVLMHYVPVMDGEAKAAEYISKILRGAKIKDLAVQEPQEFDLSVNMTTLKRNGLTMSRDVLSRARKVE